MRPISRLVTLLPLLGLLTVAARPAAAQEDGEDWAERCRRGWNGNRDRANHCEVRETRLRADGTLRVDGRENGGVEVRGWDRNEVLVQARIQAWAPDRAEAQEIARDIRVQTGGGTVQADGPDARRNNRGWSVSYRVFVPRRTNLELDTRNGPISVREVSGRMDLEAWNGPLAVTDVSGEVRGRTRNGPVRAELTGARWSGTGLDLETTNGPVVLSIPEGYSAQLETGNVHGPIDLDFPITMRGRLGNRINTTLGRGGPPIRVITTNGPVAVRRQ